MRQLAQKLRDGQVRVMDVPAPVAGPGMLLVANRFSLVSAGTEGSTVRAARKGLIGKARERPEQVKQVIDTLIQQGPVQTYRAVMKKLDSYSPLGYSSAGVVISAGADVSGYAPGDLVACGGAGYANHAEVVAVPVNLCVRLAPEADLAKAAYNTLGAIALQGVRQAGLNLGECAVVIGLGLLGQLTCLLLRASGVRTIGIDIDASAVQTAKAHAADEAFVSGAEGLAERIDEMTGIGADAVVITAATESLAPINLAGRLLRKKGRVVIVGDVPTGFDRDPYYYRKELDLRMSCSYGPGRYDRQYEEKGRDYPHAYVRWTENRNMQAFQALVHSGRIDIGYLTTHRFGLDNAPAAYNLILKGAERTLGVLIEYDEAPAQGPPRIEAGPSRAAGLEPAAAGVAFIGTGSYAMGNLLPNIPKSEAIALKGVMAASGTSSRSAAERFGFEFCTSDEGEILGNDEINTVFVATRHDTHAEYVTKALRAGKNVFVEKPLCLNESELAAISGLMSDSPARLVVGFNRRFSPLARMTKEAIGQGPLSMLYRVNPGHIPGDSWIQDAETGGGRIIGEVCHMIDLFAYISGSLPVSVYASAMRDPGSKEDVVALNITAADGSVCAITYYANGAKSLPKEYVEVYSLGSTLVIDDYRELTIHTAKGRPKRKKLLSQDKGQAALVKAFMQSITGGCPAPIGFDEIRAVTLASFRAVESIRSGSALRVEGAPE